MKAKNTLRVYELFAGIGAPHEAIRRNNLLYKVVGACEKDKYARAIYRYQFKPRFEVDHDAKGLLPKTDFDCLVFGWPCQDNSIAGKRAGQKEGTRSGLLNEAVRILQGKKPKYFIAENVPGLFSVNNGNAFYETIRMFTDVGYDCQWQVLNTRWFLPQNRERIYFVGHLREKPRPQIFPVTESDFNITESGEQLGRGLCAVGIDSSYYKGADGKRTMIMESGLLHSRGFETRKDGVSHSLKGAGGGSSKNMIMRVDENAPHYQNRIYSEDGISPPSPTGAGGNHQPFVRAVLTPDRLEKRQNGPRFKEDGTAFTHTATDRHGVQVDSLIRHLTPIECERLQGFSTTEKSVIIRVCLDHQKKSVLAEMKNHKLLKSAGGATAKELQETASSAKNPLNINRPQISKPVALHVLINFEASTLEIRNQEKSLLLASVAESKKLFPPLLQIDDFAHLNVLIDIVWGKTIMAGKAESARSDKRSFLHQNGNKYVVLSGQETKEYANDVIKNTKRTQNHMKSIISGVGQNFHDLETCLITLCCCAIHAINSFIPEKIKNMNSYDVKITEIHGYTAKGIDDNGNEIIISDTQRYKTCGNAMSVPVIGLILKRLIKGT